MQQRPFTRLASTDPTAEPLADGAFILKAWMFRTTTRLRSTPNATEKMSWTGVMNLIASATNPPVGRDGRRNMYRRETAGAREKNKTVFSLFRKTTASATCS